MFTEKEQKYFKRFGPNSGIPLSEQVIFGMILEKLENIENLLKKGGGIVEA